MTPDIPRDADWQTALIFAIRHFGKDQHPDPSPENLRYFQPAYVRECLVKACASDKLNQKGHTAMTAARLVFEDNRCTHCWHGNDVHEIDADGGCAGFWCADCARATNDPAPVDLTGRGSSD